MVTEMECVFCHYYDSMEGICNKTKEPRHGYDPSCQSFMYYKSNFKMSMEPDDYFSFFLGNGTRYLIEGRKDKVCWLCFMSDTLDDSFLAICFEAYFNLTKEDCIKTFLRSIQRKMEYILSVLKEDIYEISKKEYLSLMDEKKEVE